MGRIKKLRIIFLAVMISLLLPVCALSAEADPYVKIGLYYGTTALESANLSYELGDGYHLGYFESSGNHNALYSLGDKRITVLMAKKYYFASKAFSLSSGGEEIGLYHVELDFMTEDISEALDILASVREASPGAYPAYIDGFYRVRIGSYTTKDAASSAISAFKDNIDVSMTVVSSSGGYRVASTDTGKILFEFSDNGKALGVLPFTNDGSEPSTWHKNEIYPGGFIFSYSSGNNITVINILKLQDYVKGVVPYEINPNWPVEAQKAQAICAKNYAMANTGRHSSGGFDLCTSVHCQVYRGIRTATDLSNSAVDDVYGQYVTYGGEIISAFYHSSNGGSTESAKNIWGTEIPYLQPVIDEYENINQIPNGVWKKEITTAEITNILRDKGYSTGNIADVFVETFTDSGNVYKLTFIDTAGIRLSFERERARTILGSFTISQRYTISPKSALYVQNGNVLTGGLAETYVIGAGGTVTRVSQQSSQLSIITGSGVKTGIESGDASTYIISGQGYGHNVGMSQYGAKGMAEAGFTYDEIIKHYFTGVEITNAD